MMNSYFLMQLL